MKPILLFTACALTIGALAAPALAEPGKGRGHGQDKGKAHVALLEPHLRGARFDDGERERIRDFIVLQERRDCPPGLAKKGNGCMPPGHAKPYRVGEVLAVKYPQSIWHALADMISPPPENHRYVRINHDVLLVEDHSNRVIDVVSVD